MDYQPERKCDKRRVVIRMARILCHVKCPFLIPDGVTLRATSHMLLRSEEFFSLCFRGGV